MTIELPTSFYKTNDRIFKAKSIQLHTGLSVLVGCNGTGKTTFLKILESHCKKNNIPLFSYDNLFDGGDNAKSHMLLNNDIIGVARNMMSSEGENISNNIANIAKKIGAFVYQNKAKNNTLVLMFDAVDSGLSIDNIVEIKSFFKFILSNGKDLNFYIVVSANSYEMANGEQCVDITNGKYITFNNYNEYRAFVVKSSEIKNKRYERERRKDENNAKS